MGGCKGCKRLYAERPARLTAKKEEAERPPKCLRCGAQTTIVSTTTHGVKVYMCKPCDVNGGPK